MLEKKLVCFQKQNQVSLSTENTLWFIFFFFLFYFCGAKQKQALFLWNDVLNASHQWKQSIELPRPSPPTYTITSTFRCFIKQSQERATGQRATKAAEHAGKVLYHSARSQPTSSGSVTQATPELSLWPTQALNLQSSSEALTEVSYKMNCGTQSKTLEVWAGACLYKKGVFWFGFRLSKLFLKWL